MQINSNSPVSLPSANPAQFTQALATPLGTKEPSAFAEELLSTKSTEGRGELEDAFKDFVGQTFFGEMIKAFRTTQQPSKYFHGGRAEEIFQGQFDQVLTEKLSDASSDQIADPMFDLFMMKRAA